MSDDANRPDSFRAYFERLQRHPFLDPNIMGELESLPGQQIPGSAGVNATDGTTTVSPAEVFTFPAHTVTDSGAGVATLALLAAVYGGEATINTVAASSTAQTLNPSAGNTHDVTLTANCTFTLGAATSGKSCTLMIVLRQDATGSRTVTWPVSVTWINGSAPVLKTAASSIDIVFLTTKDGGTVWNGWTASGIDPTTTEGDLIYRHLGVLARLPVGTSGTALFSDGTDPGYRAIAEADVTNLVADLAAVRSSDHEHVLNVTLSGDGATTAFEIPAAPFDQYSVAAYVAGVRTAVTMSGGILTTMTFGAAPAAGTDNIIVDIVAALA